MVADNERPCKRCQKRNIQCSSHSLDQMGSESSPEKTHKLNDFPDQPGLHVVDKENQGALIDVGMLDGVPLSEPGTTIESRAQVPVSLPDPDLWDTSFDQSFPSFFESIMVPNQDWVEGEASRNPPELSAIIPEQEDWFGSNSIFGLDFALAMDQALVPPTTDGQNPTLNDSNPDTGAISAGRPNDSARQRHSIFQNSPW
jgi:hypothetical protein